MSNLGLSRALPYPAAHLDRQAASETMLHPIDADLSMGTPVLHPIDEDLSMGTPVLHPIDEDLSMGTPVLLGCS